MFYLLLVLHLYGRNLSLLTFCLSHSICININAGVHGRGGQLELATHTTRVRDNSGITVL